MLEKNEKTTTYLVGYTITGDDDAKNRLREELRKGLEGIEGAESINQSMLKYPNTDDFWNKIKKVCQKAETNAGNVPFEKGDFVKVYCNSHLCRFTTKNTAIEDIEDCIIERLVYGSVD